MSYRENLSWSLEGKKEQRGQSQNWDLKLRCLLGSGGNTKTSSSKLNLKDSKVGSNVSYYVWRGIIACTPASSYSLFFNNENIV